MNVHQAVGRLEQIRQMAGKMKRMKENEGAQDREYASLCSLYDDLLDVSSAYIMAYRWQPF